MDSTSWPINLNSTTKEYYDLVDIALGGPYPAWTGEGGLLARISLLAAAALLLIIILASSIRLCRACCHMNRSSRVVKMLRQSAKQRSLVFCEAPHCWDPETLRLGMRQVCIVCSEIPTEDFQRCQVCGVACHTECAPDASPDCKRLCVPALPPHSRTPPSRSTSPAAAPASPSAVHADSMSGLRHRRRSRHQAKKPKGFHTTAPSHPGGTSAASQGGHSMRHHWVDLLKDVDFPEDYLDAEGEAECCLCAQPAPLSFLLGKPVWGCIWCQSLAHAECVVKDFYKKKGKFRECELGPHRRMILPPLCVHERALPSPSAAFNSTRSTSDSPEDQFSPPISKFASPPPCASSSFHNTKTSNLHKKSFSMSDLNASGKLRSGKSIDDPRKVLKRVGTKQQSMDEGRIYGSCANLGGVASATPFADPSNYELVGVPSHVRPLLVFVNGRSGCQGGSQLCRRLRRQLHPLQVVELRDKRGPSDPLRLFLHLPHLRILVAGGDGTVSWVLQELDKILEEEPAQAAQVPRPPVAVVPLGTGNDLARVLGWASQHGWGLESGQLQISSVLSEVWKAPVALLDRWKIKIQPRRRKSHGGGGDLVSAELSGSLRIMNNYLGVGVDAKVALGVHNMRESHPRLFVSQVGNKLWYTGLGAGESLSHSCSNLTSSIQIECDGRPLDLPPDIEGLLVLNIGSFMGGVNLWRAPEGGPPLPGGPQSQHDGKLEVVGVYGTLHLGKLQIGFSNALCLAQCSSVKIRTSEHLPVQVDGEPWVCPPSSFDIQHHNQVLQTCGMI